MFRALALAAVVITASCASALTGIQDTSLRLEFDNGGVCSGTAVSERVLLSADHCWNDHSRLITINGQPANALKIERDGRDHVLVRTTHTFTRWARMGPEPVQGDRVRWVGNPAGMERQFRTGYAAGEHNGAMNIDANAWSGDSGSGLFDDSGRLVGVVSGMRRWSNARGFSMQFAVAYPMDFTPEQWRAVR